MSAKDKYKDIFDAFGNKVGSVDNKGNARLIHGVMKVQDYEAVYYDVDSEYDLKNYMDNMDIARQDVISIETRRVKEQYEYAEGSHMVDKIRLWYWREA